MGAHSLRSTSASLVTCVVLLLLASAMPMASQTPPVPANPEVAVVFHLPSTDFEVVDHKYRVFYNKFEKKSLPIEGYDLRSALQDEVMNTLSADTRYRWRLATDTDKLDAAQLADEKHRTAAMVANAQADRVLVVHLSALGGMITGLAKDKMWIGLVVSMVDRGTGRQLWKKSLTENIPFSGDLQKLQSDNQKEMKEGINTLIEKGCIKLKAKVAETKI